MNILIYNGNGTSSQSVQQTYRTLKSLLGHAYDIMKVNTTTLQNEPWEESCSLLVMPGGRDVPYVQDCHGVICDRIKRYVHGGGRYLGLCAGAYFASAEVEFEKGASNGMEVVGKRELGFFPGVCRGTMFPGFVYNSEKGARAVSVVKSNEKDQVIKSYYNGGGYFVNAEEKENVEVVCTYKRVEGDGGLCRDEESPAAGVKCNIGKGYAVLFGIHPEYDVDFVDLEENENKEMIKKELQASLPYCRDLLTETLAGIGLKTVSKQETSGSNVPEVTPIYLSTVSSNLLKTIIARWADTIDSNQLLTDSNDSFYISQIEKDNIAAELEKLSLDRKSEDKPPILKILYPEVSSASNSIQIPEKSLTPLFNLETYFKCLLERRKLEWGGGAWYEFGNAIMYSKVITSTQTVLDKNYKFATSLPSGLVCIATNQIAGRGRGRNSWVSQAGALQFSFLVRHSLQLSHAPVVFVQYIIALAIVESIRTRPRYEQVPLRLKWPNDIYADLPAEGGLKKVGGLLVNSSFVDNEFLLVIGCGINLDNEEPTVSINDVIQKHDSKLKRLEREDVLAQALVTFERFYMEFCKKGMGAWFLDNYYQRWLHSDKQVVLTTHDNEIAKIVGITSDYGMLEAVSVDNPRKKFTLQPDGNSFDMLKGLIIKKT